MRQSFQVRIGQFSEQRDKATIKLVDGFKLTAKEFRRLLHGSFKIDGSITSDLEEQYMNDNIMNIYSYYIQQHTNHNKSVIIASTYAFSVLKNELEMT